MTIRRIEAIIEITRHRSTQAGNVYRRIAKRHDITRDILALPLPVIHRLRDDGRDLKRIAQRKVGDLGTVDGVIAVESVMECIGVSRLCDITLYDMMAARRMAGMIRPKPKSTYMERNLVTA